MEETTSSDDLHIIATGAATSLGSYAAATLAAVQARIANFADHSYLLDLQGEPLQNLKKQNMLKYFYEKNNYKFNFDFSFYFKHFCF